MVGVGVMEAIGKGAEDLSKMDSRQGHHGPMGEGAAMFHRASPDPKKRDRPGSEESTWYIR